MPIHSLTTTETEAGKATRGRRIVSTVATTDERILRKKLHCLLRIFCVRKSSKKQKMKLFRKTTSI